MPIRSITLPTRGKSTRFTCVVKKWIVPPCGGNGRNENGTWPQEAQNSPFFLFLMCLFVAALLLYRRAILPASRMALLRWRSGRNEVLAAGGYQCKQCGAAGNRMAMEALGDTAFRI